MMNWFLHQTTSNASSLPPIQLPIPQPPPPQPPPPPPPPPQLSEETNLVNRISPSILLIIVILAVIFFISGLLHLLVRYLLRPTAREPDGSDSITALQGQLQQLFHLHDSGVDQSFIDTLPVFMYKAIIGLKDPFDCAVCLCEFQPDDKLRLLPKCSHAFHVECIDTWLLSHSTCPLCRSSLVPDFSPSNICSPAVLVLESGSGSESSREIGIGSSHRGDYDASAHVGFPQEGDFGPPIAENSQKLGKEDVGSAPVTDVSEAKVVQVKLGKFHGVDASGNGVAGGGEGSSSSGNLDQRRCFSMGSYEYVMDETSFLQVAIKPSKKKPSRFKKVGNAMSECDCHSRREGFKGFDSSKSLDCGSARIISAGKRESFSVSKIWLRSKKDKPAASEDSSRRASSFRLPLHRESAAEAKAKAKRSVSPRTVSEFDADLDVEVGSCNDSMASFGSQLEEAPSFARRTLLWIVGRQSRVGSHNLR